LLFLPAAAAAQGAVESQQQKFRVVPVLENLEHPWAVGFLPGGDMLITERAGKLLYVRKGESKGIPVAGLPEIAEYGQGGLLDVLVHPDFSNNRTIFISYAAGDALVNGLGTEVAKGRLNGPKLEDVQVIFKAEPKIRLARQHFGSRLLIGPDDKLYISLGERGQKEESQNPENHLGAMIRINQDGSIPDDNPFADHAKNKPEIFSYGHRNVQGMALRPGTEEIWTHEHGPKGGDEINILKKGANYGWPETTHGIDYTGLPITDKTEAPGIEKPLLYWDPSIAPSGMMFYTGDKFPAWKNDLFVGALVLTHLRRLEIKDGQVAEQEVLLEGNAERIRDVRQGLDGFIYVLTDDAYGRLLRLEPVP
jgi:glucose/arabinose dehydrogenase